ncbi:MAG TPA: serine/threonine-protein kinase [Polyangiaceae bacterium]
MTVAHAAWESSPKTGTELETLLELGQGGMATAYLARAVGTAGFQRFVVLKRMNLDLLGDRDALERFMAEARVAARIHHANVVGTQQIGRDAAGPFIVLDYVEGGSLDDLVTASAERGETLPVPVLLRVALDALAGLDAVHRAEDTDGGCLSILHRDVSLQNVLVGVHDGVSRLADFGVAKSALGVNRTNPSFLVGKLCYLAPEYLRREPCGASLDTYALGVTLWIALTGQELWPRATEGQVVRAILDEGIPPLDGYVKVAPDIAWFVARACHPDPQKRFRTAREMADAVESFDRDCGWVASHDEVAAFVRERLGQRLRYRREALAQLSSGERRARRSGSPDQALRTTTPDRRVQPAREASRRAEPDRSREQVQRRANARRRPFARFVRHFKPIHGVALLCALAALSSLALVAVSDQEPQRAREMPPLPLQSDPAPPPAAPAEATPPAPTAVAEPVPRAREVAPPPVTPVSPAARPKPSRPPEERIEKRNPYR